MKLISDVLTMNGIRQHEYADEMPSNFKVVKAQFLLGVRTKNMKMVERALKLLPKVHTYCVELIKDDLEHVGSGGDVDTSEYNKKQMSVYKLMAQGRDMAEKYGDELYN